MIALLSSRAGPASVLPCPPCSQEGVGAGQWQRHTAPLSISGSRYLAPSTGPFAPSRLPLASVCLLAFWFVYNKSFNASLLLLLQRGLCHHDSMKREAYS